MLIAVDIGNTNIVLGFIEDEQVAATYRITTKSNHTSDEFGIMMLLNLAVGACTPPVGLALFTGCAVGKMPMEKVMKSIVPFYVAMFAALMLVTYIPWFSMFLPNLLMG